MQGGNGIVQKYLSQLVLYKTICAMILIRSEQLLRVLVGARKSIRGLSTNVVMFLSIRNFATLLYKTYNRSLFIENSRIPASDIRVQSRYTLLKSVCNEAFYR